MEFYIENNVDDITYLSELTLDIKDVKGSIRTSGVAILRRTTYVVFSISRVLIEGDK